MKIEFVYRNHIKRNIVAIIIAIVLLIPLQMTISVVLQDEYFMGIMIVTIILYINTYYYLTKNRFMRYGYYKFYDEKLMIKLNHIYNINVMDIKKVFCFQKTWLGEEYLVLKIKTQDFYVTIITPDFVEKPKYKTLYGLYERLKSYNFFESQEIDEEYFELVNIN